MDDLEKPLSAIIESNKKQSRTKESGGQKTHWKNHREHNHTRKFVAPRRNLHNQKERHNRSSEDKGSRGSSAEKSTRKDRPLKRDISKKQDHHDSYHSRPSNSRNTLAPTRAYRPNSVGFSGQNPRYFVNPQQLILPGFNGRGDQQQALGLRNGVEIKNLPTETHLKELLDLGETAKLHWCRIDYKPGDSTITATLYFKKLAFAQDFYKEYNGAKLDNNTLEVRLM